MSQHDDERESDTGFDSLEDATGMDRPDERSPIQSGRDVEDAGDPDEASGDEKTAVEGAAGLGATQETWGGTPTGVEGGAGTHVPAEGDEHRPDAPDERRDSSDPRGY